MGRRSAYHLSVGEGAFGRVLGHLTERDAVGHGVISLEARVALLLLARQVADLGQVVPLPVRDGAETSLEIGEPGWRA